LQRERLTARVRYLQRHDEQPLSRRWRHYHPDDDRGKTMCEDLFADARTEHVRANPSANLLQDTPLICVSLIVSRVIPKVAAEIEQSVVFRVSRIKRNGMVAEKGSIRVL
jgi:hypothetical protein